MSAPAKGKVVLVLSKPSLERIRGGLVADETGKFVFLVDSHSEPISVGERWEVEADVEAITTGIDFNLPRGSLLRWVTKGSSVLEVHQPKNLEGGSDPPPMPD
jgi:hypothetical protein